MPGRKFIHPHTEHSFWHEHQKFIIGISATLVMTVGVFFLQGSTKDFMASVLNIQQPAPFDGTSLPITKSPNWVALSSNEYSLLSAELPLEKVIDLPSYDPGVFGTQIADLNWSRSSDKTLVNQLITYSTPYMGNYSGHSKEGDGSHLAADIKMTKGTDVHAVANGRVEKIAKDAPGFGNYVLIRHDNVPLLDSNETETLYSTYAHLSALTVAKGEIVTRGQKIGEVGNSGTSTGSHLHFQIDRSTAPWHPWWPYSSRDTAAAGISFSDGIDAGLGREAAYINTINPMPWVQRYLATTPVSTELHASAAEVDTTPIVEPDTTTTDTPAETPTATEPVIETPVVVEPVAEPQLFAFAGDSFAMVGNTATVQVQAVDTAGTTQADYQSDTAVQLTVSGAASLNKNSLGAGDFSSGVATVQVSNTTAEKVNLSIADTSYEISFIEGVAGIANFDIQAPKDFVLGQAQEIVLQAVDVDGNPTPSSRIAGTVQLSTSTGLGTFTPATLTGADFDMGTTAVSLTYPAPTSFTIKAQEGTIIGTTRTINPRLFSDVSIAHQNYAAISFLKTEDIIGGYPDGTFQPSKTVSRVEAMKMILGGLGIDAGTAASLSFPDTESSAWYAPFVAKAVELDMAKGYPDGTFQPGNTVNRAEYYKILIGGAGIETNAVTTAPYDDVSADAWFASFVAAAKAKNIIPTTSNTLSPSSGMTRAEVAETIYRLIMLRETGAASYSADLVL